MPNRMLSEAERTEANLLLESIRARLCQLAGDDASLLFALRRKVYKELAYDERGKPIARRKLKVQKAKEQNGQCASCSEALAATGNVLDRTEAMLGYTAANTKLICPVCDQRIQQSRNFS